jgi:hypothetical protein
MQLKIVRAALLSVAACSSSIPASVEAQQHGVEAYDVSGDSIALVGHAGATLAVLRVSEPAADARRVEIEYASGQLYVDDVSRPVDGLFRAPVLETREGFVQADPALKAFFAAHALQFAAEHETADDSTPDPMDGCNTLTWVSVCEQCLQNSAHPCTYTHIPGGKVAHGHAHCPPKGNNCAWADLVSKDRTCYAGGSCSQHALGFFACGESGARLLRHPRPGKLGFAGASLLRP